jgi:CheY-like chemotaxis protein
MARILLIDDDRDVIELLRFLLEQDGHKVSEAYDGVEGVELALAELPDLIILDIMMPKRDGYTANQQLLEHTQTKDIPIMILTAKGQMRGLFETAPNVRSYMEKPFEARELRRNVANTLANNAKATDS